MTVCEAALLFRLAPEDLVIAVRVERRVDVDEVDAAVGQLTQLVKVIAAVDDARLDEWGGFGGLHLANRSLTVRVESTRQASTGFGFGSAVVARSNRIDYSPLD
jgi:hypothetical protein